MDKNLVKKAEQAANDPRTTRAMLALLGLANGKLRVSPFIVGKVWIVSSTMSGESHEYMVGQTAQLWACDCKDWQKRQQDCKHILAVKLLTEGRV